MSLILDEHPNSIAEELTGRPYVSFSAIGSYQQCPLRYFFKYVEGLPEETVSASLVLGSGIHSAAEHHFNQLMVGDPAPDHDTLLVVFWDAWQSRAEEAQIQFNKTEDINAIGKTADRILAEFCRSDFAKPAGQIIGVEEQLRGELVPGVPDLLARVDLVVESDEAVTITDLKTSRSRWNASHAEDAGQQLLLYGELARHLAPDKAVKLEFAVITKVAKPVAERWPVAADPQRVDRTKKIIERVWRSIERGNFYPAPSAMNCGGCPFRAPCRAWG